MASRVFFCHVLRVHMSEFDEDAKEQGSGIEERYRVIGMFVIIMSAEIC